MTGPRFGLGPQFMTCTRSCAKHAQRGITGGSMTSAQQGSAAKEQLTPASSHLWTGAMPEARRMLLEGQCAMPRPLEAYSWQSASSRQQQCANHASSLSHPTSLLAPCILLGTDLAASFFSGLVMSVAWHRLLTAWHTCLQECTAILVLLASIKPAALAGPGLAMQAASETCHANASARAL